MIDPDTFLAALEQPWLRCLDLACRSLGEGSIPIGSVLTDGTGAIVAEGRNRTFGSPSAPEPGLAASYIAHAEINVLSQLPPGEYEDHTLWSTLEPCFLCSAAAAHSHVGHVRFAAADPLMRGVEQLPVLNEWLGGRLPTRAGPVSGPLGVVGGLLHVLWNVERRPDGVVARAYRGRDPGLLDAALRVREAGSIRDSMDLPAVLEAMWPHLPLD